MKRKILTVLLATIAYTTLVGCGSSQEPTTVADYEEPTDAAVYADEAEEEPAISTEPAPSSGLEDVTGENDDFGRPPEDDIVPWDEMEESEGVNEEVPVAGEVEGIIVLQADYKTNPFAPTFVVSAINPQTGDYHTISSFTFEHVARAQETEFLVEPAYELARYFNYRDMFNDDFTLMAATKTFLGNEEKHAGWVNQSGEFFDVTEALGESRRSDFDAAKHYKTIGFTLDGNFAYADVEDPRHPVYYMVSLNNITPRTSYQVEGSEPYIMDDYSDSWRWARGHYQTCWIDDNQFLAVTYDSQVMICEILTVSSQSATEIVPIGSQTSWSPVLGPDSSSIAFMSAPQKGTENPGIYFTDINGTTPIRLETSYNSFCGRVGDGGSVLYNISPGYYYASILDWK